MHKPSFLRPASPLLAVVIAAIACLVSACGSSDAAKRPADSQTATPSATQAPKSTSIALPTHPVDVHQLAGRQVPGESSCRFEATTSQAVAATCGDVPATDNVTVEVDAPTPTQLQCRQFRATADGSVKQFWICWGANARIRVTVAYLNRQEAERRVAAVAAMVSRLPAAGNQSPTKPRVHEAGFLTTRGPVAFKFGGFLYDVTLTNSKIAVELPHMGGAVPGTTMLAVQIRLRNLQADRSAPSPALAAKPVIYLSQGVKNGCQSSSTEAGRLDGYCEPNQRFFRDDSGDIGEEDPSVFDQLAAGGSAYFWVVATGIGETARADQLLVFSPASLSYTTPAASRLEKALGVRSLMNDHGAKGTAFSTAP